jgi:hypothetical protein
MEDGGWRMEDGGWRMEDGGSVRTGLKISPNRTKISRAGLKVVKVFILRQGHQF